MREVTEQRESKANRSDVKITALRGDGDAGRSE